MKRAPNKLEDRILMYLVLEWDMSEDDAWTLVDDLLVFIREVDDLVIPNRAVKEAERKAEQAERNEREAMEKLKDIVARAHVWDSQKGAACDALLEIAMETQLGTPSNYAEGALRMMGAEMPKR